MLFRRAAPSLPGFSLRRHPSPPALSQGRVGRSLNSLGTGSRPAGLVLWTGWNCYPAERPGGLEHGLREEGRLAALGGWTAAREVLLSPTRSGATSTLFVFVALEPWGVVKFQGWTAATATSSAY